MNQLVRGIMRWLISQNEERMVGWSDQQRMKVTKLYKSKIQKIFESVQI